jgi:hypothetical protein
VACRYEENVVPTHNYNTMQMERVDGGKNPGFKGLRARIMAVFSFKILPGLTG